MAGPSVVAVGRVERRLAPVEPLADDLASRRRRHALAVKPNSLRIVPAGALAPKWSMPMIAPSSPAYRSQPSETPASTVTRFLTAAAGPLAVGLRPGPRSAPSRGGDTTRVGMPSASSVLGGREARARAPSPCAIRISSGAAARGLAQDVPAAADALARELRRARQGRQLLAGERQGDRPLVAPAIAGRSTASAQAAAASFASPGPDEPQVRDRAQGGVVLDRLVGRAVLAEADGVVGPDVDHVQARRAPRSGRSRACSR